MTAPRLGVNIEAAASEWLVKMSERALSPQERAQFEGWLAADPEHQRVYRAQQRAWIAIAALPHLLDETLAGTGWSAHREGQEEDRAAALVVVRPRPRPQRRRRMWAVAIAACLLLAAIGAWSRWVPMMPFGPQVHETSIARVKDITLEDGSLITLGASSRIAVDFSAHERRVTLLRGEAFFEVARDTARSFFVVADATEVRVVGTKFDVHRGIGSVRVSVLEGRVEVTRARPAARPQTPRTAAPKRVLGAGEAVMADGAGALAKPDPVNLPDVGAWRSGRLVYVDARLRDIVADVNRYYGGSIEIADPRVGDLQLTTTFRADQIDDMLAVFTRALPVQATRTGHDRIVLTTRQ